MTGPIDTHCPVHILQGMADQDVPHSHALKLVSLLPADDVTLSLIPDGDHRLSRPQDLAMLMRAARGDDFPDRVSGWCLKIQRCVVGHFLDDEERAGLAHARQAEQLLAMQRG